jgi:hypothetical protein
MHGGGGVRNVIFAIILGALPNPKLRLHSSDESFSDCSRINSGSERNHSFNSSPLCGRHNIGVDENREKRSLSDQPSSKVLLGRKELKRILLLF